MYDAKKKIYFIRTDTEFISAQFKHNSDNVIAREYTDEYWSLSTRDLRLDPSHRRRRSTS
jgi:DNA topoisomerase IA